jgi:hypothetical protein
LGKFIDANGDAHPDLFMANEANRGNAMPSPNRLFVNGEGADTATLWSAVSSAK